MKRLTYNTLIFGVIALVVYLVFFLFFDKEISHKVNDHLAGTKAQHIGTIVSTFAFGAYYRFLIALGFLVVVINAMFGNRSARWSQYLLVICVTLSVAIVFGDGIKYFLGRYRPVMSFDQGLYGLHFFSTEWELNSSPSGHSIRAFALLTCLSLLFRRMTPLFISLAVLIGLSRVLVTAHYPSDVIFGAYIGIFIALWAFRFFSYKDGKPVEGMNI